MRLVDLSTAGCGVGLADETLEIGRVVTLRLPVGDTIRATVIWANDQAAGLKFTHSLHVAVVLGFDEWERLDGLVDGFGRVVRLPARALNGPPEIEP